MAARNYQGKESEQSKARRKKKSGLSAEALIAGMRGNRNMMPTLGSEYFRKKKKR